MTMAQYAPLMWHQQGVMQKIQKSSLPHVLFPALANPKAAIRLLQPTQPPPPGVGQN